jgi:hypothetical protein
MKAIIFLIIASVSLNTFAVVAKNKTTRIPTQVNSCDEDMKKAIKDLESKASNVNQEKVTLQDFKLIGAGSNLSLYAAFVNSPSTADNTHWEVVAELNYQTGSCKVVASKRMEAP